MRCSKRFSCLLCSDRFECEDGKNLSWFRGDRIKVTYLQNLLTAEISAFNRRQLLDGTGRKKSNIRKCENIVRSEIIIVKLLEIFEIALIAPTDAHSAVALVALSMMTQLVSTHCSAGFMFMVPPYLSSFPWVLTVAVWCETHSLFVSWLFSYKLLYTLLLPLPMANWMKESQKASTIQWFFFFLGCDESPNWWKESQLSDYGNNNNSLNKPGDSKTRNHKFRAKETFLFFPKRDIFSWTMKTLPSPWSIVENSLVKKRAEILIENRWMLLTIYHWIYHLFIALECFRIEFSIVIIIESRFPAEMFYFGSVRVGRLPPKIYYRVTYRRLRLVARRSNTRLGRKRNDEKPHESETEKCKKQSRWRLKMCSHLQICVKWRFFVMKRLQELNEHG